MKISERIRSYLHCGNGMGMGTRNAEMQPEYQRVLGGYVDEDERFNFFFDIPTARHTIRNLEENQDVVLVGCSNTFESYQLKGKALKWYESTEEELKMIDEYFKKFIDSMAAFGISDSVLNYPHSKMMTLTMEVHEMFEQTPKPGTGQKIKG